MLAQLRVRDIEVWSPRAAWSLMGDEYGWETRYLVFFQALGNATQIRGIQAALKRPGQAAFFLHTPATHRLTLPPGKWETEVHSVSIQGLPLMMLNAYLPAGKVDRETEEIRFLVLEGGIYRPQQHDPCFRRWLETYTPFPVPSDVSLCPIFQGEVRGAQVTTCPSYEGGGTSSMIVVAFTDQVLRRLLEVSM